MQVHYDESMEWKKTLALIGFFFGLVLINGLLITALYRQHKIQASHLEILAEIDAYKLAEDTPSSGSNAPLVLGEMTADVKLVDGRSAALRRYLRSIDSPLFDYADILVEEADKYGYDYRLLAAIAMQESTGCKRIPPDSHNCWGWGIYGDTVTTFDSYEEAIRTVSQGIKTGYIDRGLVTTEDIMKRYTPSSNGSWAYAVRFFFNKIENY